MTRFESFERATARGGWYCEYGSCSKMADVYVAVLGAKDALERNNHTWLCKEHLGDIANETQLRRGLLTAKERIRVQLESSDFGSTVAVSRADLEELLQGV
jgi:hypothetical protein